MEKKRPVNIANIDICDAWKEGAVVCVTTNGFVRKDGRAVMGRGNARAMAALIPDLPDKLGTFIDLMGNHVGLVHERVIAFPVKPERGTIDDALPHARHLYVGRPFVPGYHCKASPELIYRSATELAALIEEHGWPRVYLPLPGVGNGGLTIADIRNTFDFLSSHPQIVIVSLRGRGLSMSASFQHNKGCEPGIG